MPNHTQSKHNSTTSFSAHLFILVLLASVLSSCGTVLQVPLPTPTQESTLVPPTQVPTDLPTSTVTVEPTVTPTPEPTATATEVATPTEVVSPMPKPTEEVDELGIRVEFPLGQGMTREELKSSVEWFYDLSDGELNEIVKDNLWSFKLFPNDSRPRDPGDNTKVIRDYEDLGWYYRDQESSYGTLFGDNQFNGIYLGTIKTFVEGIPSFFVSAIGTKDWLGNRFILYGVTGVQDTDNFAFKVKESKKQDIYGYDGDVISPTDAVYKILNNNLKEVVNISLSENLTDITPFMEYAKSLGPEKGISAKLLIPLKGDNNLMNLIVEQRKGLSIISARELVDSSLNVESNKLPSKFSLDNFNNLVPYIHMTIPKN